MAGFSGMTNLHSDLGGYTMIDAQRLAGIVVFPAIYRSPELLIRWMEYSAFSESAFRSHPGTQPAASAQVYDDDILPYFKTYSDIFQRGREYREKVLALGTPARLPLMRHGSMVKNSAIWWEKLESPTSASPRRRDDCTTKGSSIGEQEFFVGPDLLVAPIFAERQTSKKIFLPDLAGEGASNDQNTTRWRQVFTGDDFLGGGFVTVKAPLGQIPVFYRVDGVFADVLERAYGNLTAPGLASHFESTARSVAKTTDVGVAALGTIGAEGAVFYA
jgi:alpha-glucosidase (family GH31 glycosyl hydrolase)